jgi:eukaryotic-like serine/threonine-protein kinase
MNEHLTTPGTVLMGKYRVERLLGMGNMGVVVAAIHLGFEQRVAIKLMLPGKGPDPERHERFMREGRIAARLTGQHVAKVLDVGTMDPGGAPYLVMEYLDGRDLAAILTERGPLPFAEATGYVLQVCEAAAEAHKAGIIHRDLKPANLFLSKLADGSPCVKVLDFGVSKLTEPGADLTQDTATLGSPLYMPPEQINSSKYVDARADVWALGVVLYQLVAGKTPFHGETIQQVCGRVFQCPPTPLSTYRSDAPPGFEAVILRCLEKEREQRWPNVAAFAAALVPFAPARAVVHAERAAAILGVEDVPSRVMDVLPPAPSTAAPLPAASSQPEAARSASGTLAAAAIVAPPAAMARPRRRAFAAAGLGLVIVALAAVGAVRWRGGATVSTLSATPAAPVTIAAPIVPSPTAPPPIAPAPAASTVSEPATTAAASATVAAAAPPAKVVISHKAPPAQEATASVPKVEPPETNIYDKK